MPKCPSCKDHTCPEGLVDAGGILACCKCRTPQLVAVQETAMTQDNNRKSEPLGKKSLVEIELCEVDTADGGRDHAVNVSAKIGSMSLSFATTFDDIRKFFTEKRKAGGEAKLKSI